MADRKSIMVEHLREFAHTQWGRGVDRLKARKGLLGALVTRVDELVTLMGLRERADGSTEAPPGVSATRSPPEREQPTPRSEAPAASKRPLPGDDDEKTPVYVPTRPARVVDFPPKQSAPLEATASSDVSTPAPVAPPEPARTSAEPLVEGFFVARIVTGASNAPPPDAPGGLISNGSLGSLPVDYADDTVMLLPRDPHTLFVFWDFKVTTRERAAQGLEYPRTVMRLYDDHDTLLGVIDVALESRSFYIGGLPAGRPYRVELHFVGRDGRSRRIGHSSNRVFLPPAGPSSDTSVRFLRVPSPAALRAVPRPGSVSLRFEPDEERDYITWRRVLLPGSAERLEPHVPSRAAPPGEQVAPTPGYLHVPRAEGSSSEGRVGAPRPAESPSGEAPVPPESERAPPERWVWSHGPGGSSEIWLDSAGPSGSSEQGARPMGVPAAGGDSRGPAGPSAHGFVSQGPAGSSEQASGVPRAREGVVQWIGSHGPAGSSEQGPGVSGAREGVVQWIGSHGPAGSSEQVPGASQRGEGVVQWMWVYGPVASEQGPGLAGPPGASGQWVWSSGPAGSSEQGPGPAGPPGAAGQWVWSSGPAGSSEQGPGPGGPSGATGLWVWSSGPAGSSGPGW
ncbi:hypothetical protein D187_009130 [Cystobacter fuscus DSM 2262]|uniref:DUF4912 domain-containing protein n=2 Tax=Cystobacter fuscus TaxID=43 RepID=S9Q2K7_CYSF2|nr:hypothetical protein D187_009130 [Cystobacter fuscus DSM 2262]